jgi:flap endonuclease-1
VGTDFNPEGVKGIGPKTALQLIKQHGSLEETLPTLRDATFPVEPARIREIFLDPDVSDEYHLAWKDPTVDGVIEFMCGERDFDQDRVMKALEKMSTGIKKQKGATSLEKWFS